MDMGGRTVPLHLWIASSHVVGGCDDVLRKVSPGRRSRRELPLEHGLAGVRPLAVIVVINGLGDSRDVLCGPFTGLAILDVNSRR